MKSLTLRSIPMKSLRAHKGRTLIITLLVMAQALCVTWALLTAEGTRQEMRQAQARLGADILVYPTQAMQRISADSLLMQGTPAEVWKKRSLLDRMSECQGIEKVSWQIYMKDSTGENAESPVWIAGYEPDTDFVLSPWVAEGSSANLEDGAVLAGSHVAAQGESVVLFGKSWPIKARLAQTGSQIDDMVYVNLDTFSQLEKAAAEAGETKYEQISPADSFSVALLRVADRSRVQTVTDWLNVYVRKIQAVRGEAELTDTAGSLSGQIRLITILAIVGWFVLLMCLMILQSILMKERRKEFRVWRAAGASKKIIRGQMRQEAVITHLAGGLAGAIAGLLLTLAGGHAAAVSAEYTILSAAAAAGLSILTGWMGAGLFTRKIEVRKDRTISV